MPLAVDVLILLTLVFVFALLPAVLLVSMFVLSRKYRGMFDHIGLSRKEVGLLVFGSLAANFVSIDIPFVVYGNYLLAVNASGALIPTVLSIHLLRAKRIPFAAWSLGMLGVAAITFFVTRVQPRSGIVAEFPWMFLPSLTAAALALVLYSRRSPRAPAYAYSVATMGSLIGADIFHLPQLFDNPGFIGSLGGAGVYDLVYLAGVIALAVVLMFATEALKELRIRLPEHEIRRGRVYEELELSMRAEERGLFRASIHRTLAAVQARLRNMTDDPARPMDELAVQHLVEVQARAAYDLLMEAASRPDATAEDSRWAMYQGQYVLTRLEARQRLAYAPIARRVGAFAVDAAVMTIVLIVFAALLIRYGSDVLEPAVLGATIFFWAMSMQMLYFTVFEYFGRGRSLGKMFVGLRVTDLNGRPPDFIACFARNVVRMLDFALFFYGVSVLAMLATRRVQRFGDMVGETVVVPVARHPIATPSYPDVSPRPQNG